MPSSSDSLLFRLRRADPDRYFCTLFAPQAAHEALALLYLFNVELARAWEVASQPMLALIRLQWWREVVEGAVREHELATPLRAALESGLLPRAGLLALIEARESLGEVHSQEFLAYARATGGQLARLAGAVLGADSARVEDLGTAYAITGLLQATTIRPQDDTPDADLIDHARALLNGPRPPRAALAAALPAVLARRDLQRGHRTRGVADKLAVVAASLTGWV